jgi:hypothetical protein
MRSIIRVEGVRRSSVKTPEKVRDAENSRPIGLYPARWLSVRSYIFFHLDFLREAGLRFRPGSCRVEG